jgi:hypothetical protein
MKGSLTNSALLFASRATEIIATACQVSDRSVVLLPALYCAEVASAIEQIGLRYRCYDLAPDLSSHPIALSAAYGRDVGALVLLHPFGLSRTVAEGQLPEEAVVIEDACHSLRTSCQSIAIGSIGHLVVYSPRKEFGWLAGGIAEGPLTPTLSRLLPNATAVELQWKEIDLNELVSKGLRATALASEILTDRLPPLKRGEVLTALPLKSLRRDAMINRLRAKGIYAWRWRRPLKGTGPTQTPIAWALRQRLLLVPLPTGSELEGQLDLLCKEEFETWQ